MSDLGKTAVAAGDEGGRMNEAQRRRLARAMCFEQPMLIDAGRLDRERLGAVIWQAALRFRVARFECDEVADAVIAYLLGGSGVEQ